MAMNPRLLVPRASGFNPKSIAGLEAWWDAADTANVTVDGGRVAALLDKSGKGRHAANTTSGSTQPDYVTGAVNGRNVARFVKADAKRLTVASSTAAFNFLHNGTPSYIAMVVSAGTTGDPNDNYHFMGNGALVSSLNTGIIVGYDDRVSVSANDRFNLWALTGVSAVFAVRLATRAAYNNLFSANSINLTEIAIDAGNATASNRLGLRINGGSEIADNTESGTPSTGNATADFQLGASGSNAIPMTGDICEVLLFSQQPTANQRSALRQYLGKKWGVTLP